MRNTKTIKSEKTEFEKLLNEIFSKYSNKIDISDDTIYNKQYGDRIAKFSIGNYELKFENMPCTCSMVEITGSDQFTEDIEGCYYDLIEENIRISKDNLVKIYTFLFDEWMSDKVAPTTAIFNVLKDTWTEKLLKKSKYWKKTFQYDGNDGVICTYMYKKD